MNQPAILLLVDDVAANRETLIQLFGRDSYWFLEAVNGVEALALATANPPDLVLLDVMMPDLNGFEVCRRLRANPRLAEVPIIMVTVLDDKASRLAGIEAGADDFVSKPYDRIELRARVRSLTRLNRYRRLTEQRNQFQWVVEHASDGYALVNASDEILFANARARLWLGLSPEHAAGPRETFQAAAARSYHCEPAGLWRGWPTISPATSTAARLLVRSAAPPADPFFLEVSVHDNTEGRLLQLRDVTERLAARRDQCSFQIMVEQKVRAPLNVVLGALEQLTARPDGVSAPELTAFTALAQQGAQRFNAAFEDVLRFAESARRPAAGAGFPLAEIGDLVRRVADGLALGAVAISVDPGVCSAHLACDAEALSGVLFALLENARNFHPHRAPVLDVSVRSDRDGFVTVVVSDNGRSLSPEELAHVGRPFFQGANHFGDQTPGLGLGLAAVYLKIWHAGGSCRLRNRADGPGVRAELQWPVRNLATAPHA